MHHAQVLHKHRGTVHCCGLSNNIAGLSDGHQLAYLISKYGQLRYQGAISVTIKSIKILVFSLVCIH